MRHSRRSFRWGIAVAVVLASAAVGVWFASALAPERLRAEVERQVAAATGAPCRIGSLRLAPGLPIEVEASGLDLWDGALAISQARARVSIASALVGRVRLSRLLLEAPRLRIESAPAEADAPPDPPEDLLAALHAGAGASLAALGLADHLVVRDGRIELAWPRAPRPVAFALEDVEARLSHSRLRGESTLVAQMRVRAGDADRGLLEWNGSRRGGEGFRLTLAMTELDLGWLAGLGLAADSRPGGFLSGVADVALPDREHARIELDLVAREVGWMRDGASAPLFEVPRVQLRADVDVAPGRLATRGARVRGGPVDASIEATVTRPLASGSELDLTARVANLSVDELVALLTSMPSAWVEDAREALEALDGGRVASFVVRSHAPLSVWGDGDAPERARGLPSGLELTAQLDDLRVQLGADDAIEGVSVLASWAGDRVVLRDLVGRRGGLDLPRLDLDLAGVSHLLEADLSRRVTERGDAQLAGLPLLISLFEPEPDSQGKAPRVEIRLDHLDHPAVLWPVRSLDLGIRDGGDGLLGEIRRATWAGVPLRGTLRWRGDPMHLTAELVLTSPPDAASGRRVAAPASVGDAAETAASGLPLAGAIWASGDFEIGELRSDVWSHRQLRARVRAAGSQLAFDAVGAETLPTGRVEGDALLDLGRADALPYRAVFRGEDLDADALFAQAQLGRGLVAGRVAATGDLRGRIRPGEHPSAALDGEVQLSARDGHVRHDLPVVLALTLAGEGLDFRSDREFVRYTSCESRLELRDGVAHTEALEFEGPDLRMFASGSLDLGHPPHATRAEVAVFLFRPVDRVLEAVPIVGDLILGGSDNLLAAYFRLEGPWDAPTATYQPLRTLYTGPLRIVTGLPGVVSRGLESLGARVPGEEAPVAPEAGGAP